MSSCEKCWDDSASERLFGVGSPSYEELLARRNGITERECTPEEQAGKGASACPRCGRKTIHQHTGECMVFGCADRGTSGWMGNASGDPAELFEGPDDPNANTPSPYVVQMTEEAWLDEIVDNYQRGRKDMRKIVREAFRKARLRWRADLEDAVLHAHGMGQEGGNEDARDKLRWAAICTEDLGRMNQELHAQLSALCAAIETHPMAQENEFVRNERVRARALLDNIEGRSAIPTEGTR